MQPNPDDWICQDCGLTVWARKTCCPRCDKIKTEGGRIDPSIRRAPTPREQGATEVGQAAPLPQA
eukprot:4640693-Heterocapsa_arctica.AAC.1